MKLNRLGAAALALAVTAACSEAPVGPELTDGVNESRAGQSARTASAPNIVDTAISVNEETGEFSTLLAAVGAADLVDALAAPGQRTVFAPTDAAFSALGLNAGNIGDAFDEEALRDILLYHVANGRRDAADVTSSDRIRMQNGDFNAITVTGGDAFIGEARIIQTNIETTNGIIHVIDAVLLPPTDEDEDNGEGGDEGTNPADSPTLVDVALSVNAETGEFSTLLEAVTEAGLVEALSARGQRTVFAPTDAAFAALGLDADNIADALEDDALREILLFHVAEGRRDAAEVTSSDRIRMLNGDFNEITLTAGAAFIGDAEIIQTDVMAANGIIHVIDAVLLPPTGDDD